MVEYGLTSENRFLIIEKAKTKEDGVYCFRGVTFKVKNFKVIAYAANGKVIQPAGHFDVLIGEYDGYHSEAKKLLKTL